MSDQQDDLNYETVPVPDSEECSFLEPECLGGWIQDQMTSFSLWLFEKILNGLAAVIEAIPVPGFLSNTGSLSIPPSVTWVLDSFNVDNGVKIIISAYVLRFLIRRLPFVG